MLKLIKRMIMVGDRLPSLILPIATNGVILKGNLLDFGKDKLIVMIGHPGAFTTFSTFQQIPDYKNTQLPCETVFWSVNDPYVVNHYSMKHKIAFPIICDFNGELTRTLELGLPEDEYFSYCCKRTICIVQNNLILGVRSETNVQYTEATKPEMALHLLKLILND